MSKFVLLKLLLAITPLAFVVSACKNDTTSALARNERLAKAYCACVADTKLEQLNTKATESKDLSDEVTVALFEELSKEYDKLRECVGSIKSNLGPTPVHELDSLVQFFPKKCPPVASNPQFMRELLAE